MRRFVLRTPNLVLIGLYTVLNEQSIHIHRRVLILNVWFLGKGWLAGLAKLTGVTGTVPVSFERAFVLFADHGAPLASLGTTTVKISQEFIRVSTIMGINSWCSLYAARNCDAIMWKDQTKNRIMTGDMDWDGWSLGPSDLLRIAAPGCPTIISIVDLLCTMYTLSHHLWSV